MDKENICGNVDKLPVHRLNFIPEKKLSDILPLTDKSNPKQIGVTDFSAPTKMTLDVTNDAVIPSDTKTDLILQSSTKRDECNTSPNTSDGIYLKNDDNIMKSSCMNTSIQSNISNSPGHKVKITDSMLKEEMDYQTDEVSEQEQLEAIKEMEQTSTQKSRFERLQVLLDRSEVYAKYLLERITARQETDKKKKE